MLKIGKDSHDIFPLTDESTEETALLECTNSKKVIRYRSAPLGKGKISKMKWYE
jgi:hypothetical protein